MKVVSQMNRNSEVACGSWIDRQTLELSSQEHMTAELSRDATIDLIAGLSQALIDWPAEGVWLKISNERGS